MGRCGDCEGTVSNTTCACVIVAGNGVAIAGTGDAASPFTVAAVATAASNNDLSVSGTGLFVPKHVLSGDAAYTIAAAGFAVTGSVTFPGTGFSASPQVMASLFQTANIDLAVDITARSATAFSFRIFETRHSAIAGGTSGTLMWLAYGTVL